MNAEPLIECPDCDGAGEIETCPRPGFCSHSDHKVYRCFTCNGQGEATAEQIREAQDRECDCGTRVGDITDPSQHASCHRIGH